MSGGVLEVQLINAKKLRDEDFFGKMDPYVLIRFGNQEHKSEVARGQGKNPVWNQTFTFKVDYRRVANDQHTLSFKIMDKDTFSKDDFVGESQIYVKNLLSLGMEKGMAEMHPQFYRVVLANKAYHGEIKVGVTFIHEVTKVEDEMDEDLGGWKQSTSTLAYLMKTQFP